MSAAPRSSAKGGKSTDLAMPQKCQELTSRAVLIRRPDSSAATRTLVRDNVERIVIDGGEIEIVRKAARTSSASGETGAGGDTKGLSSAVAGATAPCAKGNRRSRGANAAAGQSWADPCDRPREDLDAGFSLMEDTRTPPRSPNGSSSTTRKSAGCCGLAIWPLISSKPSWRGASPVP
jgi:hypothetical protein